MSTDPHMQIYYDMYGKQIHERFFTFLCGNKVDVKRKKYFYSQIQKRYYAHCDACNMSEWIESFSCVGCMCERSGIISTAFISSLFPIFCTHKREQCRAITCKGMGCKNKMKLNNCGYCIKHYNPSIRLLQAKKVIDVDVLCDDVQTIICDYVNEE